MQYLVYLLQSHVVYAVHLTHKQQFMLSLEKLPLIYMKI